MRPSCREKARWRGRPVGWRIRVQSTPQPHEAQDGLALIVAIGPCQYGRECCVYPGRDKIRVVPGRLGITRRQSCEHLFDPGPGVGAQPMPGAPEIDDVEPDAGLRQHVAALEAMAGRQCRETRSQKAQAVDHQPCNAGAVARTPAASRIGQGGGSGPHQAAHRPFGADRAGQPGKRRGEAHAEQQRESAIGEGRKIGRVGALQGQESRAVGAQGEALGHGARHRDHEPDHQIGRGKRQDQHLEIMHEGQDGEEIDTDHHHGHGGPDREFDDGGRGVVLGGEERAGYGRHHGGR